ncbi:MAG: glycosyltransferase [Nanoarchaeota archaeon]
MAPSINKKYDLSIIIPTYKEENRIERCIKESLFFFRNNERISNFEIIFVADNAGDHTIEIIQKYLPENQEMSLIVNEQREQKGGSVQKGMLHARYELLLFYDVDLSTPLYETDVFLNEIDDYDILIGSRGMKESKIEKKWFKVFLSRCYSLLKKTSLGLDLKDTQCGFKMFKKNSKILFEKQTIKSSAFDVEILFLAKIFNLRIKEIPITWIDSDMSNFKTHKIILNFLKETIKIRKNNLLGVYK